MSRAASSTQFGPIGFAGSSASRSDSSSIRSSAWVSPSTTSSAILTKAQTNKLTAMRESSGPASLSRKRSHSLLPCSRRGLALVSAFFMLPIGLARAEVNGPARRQYDRREGFLKGGTEEIGDLPGV